MKIGSRIFIVCAVIIIGHSAMGQRKRHDKQIANAQALHPGTPAAGERIPYDDSTLSGTSSYLLPYNKWIDPAGQVLRFGDPKLENHSLDVILMPDRQTLLVEDRYGIILYNTLTREQLARYTFSQDAPYKALMSTFSGIKAIPWQGAVHIFWGAGSAKEKPDSYVMEAAWDGAKLELVQAIPFHAVTPAPTALPNEVIARQEDKELYLYVVLNGNNQLTKIRVRDREPVWTTPTGVAPYGITMAGGLLWITNWAGPVPLDTTGKETAGVPWGSAFIDPRTGATNRGTVSVIDPASGKLLKEVEVGLHPTAIIHSPDERQVYVANGNSDYISVLSTTTFEVTDSIPVSPGAFEGQKLAGAQAGDHYAGSSPGALAIDSSGSTLYVANGLNNAIAVIDLKAASGTSVKPSAVAGASRLLINGFIPTETYPSGIVVSDNMLYVTNLEAAGARAIDVEKNAYNAHRQLASLSFIPIPDRKQLNDYTERVKRQNGLFREAFSRSLPRPGVPARPVPERIGEPSVFKHVLYIIKENRTYDQVLGDLLQGRGAANLCVFGDSVTPNQHRLAKDFCLLDNYYASGKCSAEGHQWTDAAMVTDYIERMVRAWFRSYPHAQIDALVYDKEGFIWNNALDHGKTVRIYGEACTTEIDKKLDWSQIYRLYQEHQPFDCKNISTISRVRPILSQAYPGYDDPRITDQLRADAFIKELKEFDARPGDQWPQLMVMALPNDHTTGLSPGFPTPRAMVADNDLALGRIIEAIGKSRFRDSTVIFVTEDDSQAGWDHISAYRTTGFVISPYSRLQKTVTTNYNQTSMVRTIEQILGLPPMNGIDATALPMYDCFTPVKDSTYSYSTIPNLIPLDELNRPLSSLRGRALHYAKLSLEEKLDEVDEGDDEVFNRILWFATKGTEPYPGQKYVRK